MTKIKKRNELSIFEELRLKPEDFRETPKIEDLVEIDFVYYYYNTKFKKNTYWILTEPKFTQVNEYSEGIDTDDEDYQLNIPKINTLKKFETNVKLHVEEETEDAIFYTWWQNKNGKLIQVNRTDEIESVTFKLESWLRNQAIDVVGLEIRSMKKKAYEYSSKQLEKMIIDEEDKIIKKKGWKGIKIAAALMIGYIPDL